MVCFVSIFMHMHAVMLCTISPILLALLFRIPHATFLIHTHVVVHAILYYFHTTRTVRT